MLYTLALILLILWILVLVTSYTMGGVIHVLPVVAIVMVLLKWPPTSVMGSTDAQQP